jgi:ferritin-like metal-binding protein YciE
METQKEKSSSQQYNKKCGSWIKRFICSRVARHLLCRKTLSKTLPNMAKNASTQLATSITNHLKDTNEQISRLEKIFEVTGIKPAKKSTAMEGILKRTMTLSIKRTKALFAMLV